MSRSLALFAIGLLFGGGIGFVTAAGNGITFDGHDHGDPAHHGGGHAGAMAHDHATAVDLPSGPDAPRVAIRLHKDPMSGWNLQVLPQNFRFAPQNASAENVPGEGHAHVYVNGEKLARLYAEWVHLPVAACRGSHQGLAEHQQPQRADGGGTARRGHDNRAVRR